jgi:hypothetical protein
MRKVTKITRNAFLERTEMSMSNTASVQEGKDFLYKLYGHTIAILKASGELLISNCGYQTNTTKERLNALPNVSIVQRKGTWYLNGVEWHGNLTSVGTI